MPEKRKAPARSRRTPVKARGKTRSTRSPAPLDHAEHRHERESVAFPIVGIGGSAGSLEALLQIIPRIPADLDMAIIIFQHLAADTVSVLGELLSPGSRLPIRLAADGVPVEPGNIYVMPHGTHLTLRDHRIRLNPFDPSDHQRNTIDSFFSSLARDAGAFAIGVILSGGSSDGTAGLHEIKGAAGITIAQEPRTAKTDAMPRAAIMGNAADIVLPPEKIAQELVQIRKHLEAHSILDRDSRKAEADVPLAEHMPRIFSMLRHASGVDFTHYKQPTIRRRLQRRIVLHKLHSLEQYVKYLQQNPAEIHALYQDILIHVTRFFREPESFTQLSQQILPKLMEHRGDEDPLRIWVPGCSTGEEPYSIAMSLLEYLGDGANAVTVQIFATDVSDAAVEQARSGIYPESIAADVSPERLRRFFTRVDGSYRIAKSVRDCCIFARQDLTRDPPFSKLDLIVCRNVLIYLGPILQKRLMSVFHYALKPTGFLMLGSAESVGPHIELFSVVDKRHKIYVKKPVTTRTDVDFPAVEYAGARNEAARPNSAEVRPGTSIQSEANRIVLARFSPPGVIVDNDLKIVQFRGQTGDFLEPAPGEASLNLLKMAREGLLYGLRSAIQDARKSDREVRREALRVKTQKAIIDVHLNVFPLGVNSPEGRHFLVLFEKMHDSAGAAALPVKVEKVTPRRKQDAQAERAQNNEGVNRLQQELAASREYLQSIIQDLEAANEELQSANEEILSSNEELQSTNEELDTAKEELQSTNEELNTVNEELHGRNDELMRVNSDLSNLLASVQIAIVMVASDLRIRRFTPMAEKVLNLIPTDIGRPISDIKPNIDCPDLERLITDCIDTVTIKERDVQDRLGARYSLRIRPYKNVENRIDGAVLALFEQSAPVPPSAPPRPEQPSSSHDHQKR